MMLQINEDYRIKTIKLNFVLQKRNIVKASKITKQENIGKESWIDIGYAPTLDILINILMNNFLIDSDIEDIITLQSEIKNLITHIKDLNIHINAFKEEEDDN